MSVEEGVRSDVERRAVLVRVAATWCAALGVASTILAALAPAAFGLTRSEVVVLGAVQLTLLGGASVVPWRRVLRREVGEWLLGGFHLGLVALMAVTIRLSDPYLPTLATLLLLVLALSAVTARTSTHVAVTLAAVAAWISVSLDRAPQDVGTAALWSIALVVVSTVFAVLAFTTRRAQTQADDAHAAAVQSASLVATAARSAESLASLDVDTIFTSVAEAASELGSDLAGLYVLESGGDFKLRASVGVPDAEPLPGGQPGVGGTVAATGETVRVDDYATAPFAIAGYVDMGLGSTVGVPVWSEGRLAGILVVARFRVERYTDDEVLVLELVARHAGRALQLAREAQGRVEIAERLREVDHREFELVTTVSHELRTPLAVISGLSETLISRYDDLDAGQRTMLLERVNANASALSSTLAKVLELAQLGGDDLASRYDRFDIGALVDSTAARLTPLFEQHDLTVVGSAAVPVYGDGDLIARVLENLLKNAVSHTPPGTRVEIEVRVHPMTGTVTVAVADDGPGVPAESLQRLTERFYRAGPLVERPKGLGLGLALSAEILRRHGSALEVSAPEGGAGIRFAFDLRAVPPSLQGTGDRAADR